MKKLIILVVSMLLCVAAKAIEVPDAIEKAFSQKFPAAKKIKWEKENNEYEASFILDKKEVSVTYTADGQLKETETEIAVAELPRAVSDAINKQYPNTRIHEASKITRADNSIVYEAEVKIKNKKTDLLFEENGNAVK
ncbi:MAG: PepSY-like domain-containing protein [Bacteroidia bacterium]